MLKLFLGIEKCFSPHLYKKIVKTLTDTFSDLPIVFVKKRLSLICAIILMLLKIFLVTGMKPQLIVSTW